MSLGGVAAALGDDWPEMTGAGPGGGVRRRLRASATLSGAGDLVDLVALADAGLALGQRCQRRHLAKPRGNKGGFLGGHWVLLGAVVIWH